MEAQLPAINDLPYDIFRQIIIHAYTYTPRSYRRGEDFERVQALAPPFSASHVCRAWRCALVSDQLMWTTLSIPEMKPSGVKELIRRSQSAPLHIFLFMKEAQMRYYKMLKTLSLIFPHINRFKSLRVHVELSGMLLWSSRRMAPIRQLISFLQQPAPRLQVFSFSNISAEQYFRPMFLKTLFLGSAPNLKHIEYQVFRDTTYQDLSCPLFHRLSELHLTFCEAASLESVLALLKLSSSLEVLGIYDYSWPAHGNSPSERTDAVNLPHLQRLVLKMLDSTELLNFVNEYLTFPPNVKWDIHALASNVFEHSPPLLELIPQVRFTTLNVLFEGHRWADKKAPTDFGQIDGNNLTFRFQDTYRTGMEWCDLVMFHSIDFSSVTHLNLELISRATLRVKKLFSTIFSIMENLQSLVVKQEVVFCTNPKDEACLQSLSELISTRQDGVKPLCPLLRHITVNLEDRLAFYGTPTTMFHVHSKARGESDCPLKILVYCPEAWQSDVESELQSEGDIPVSVRPFDRD